MKMADSGDIPSTFLDSCAVFQNDNILCPADSLGLGQQFRRILVCAVELPHPAEVPRGEAGDTRISSTQILSGRDGCAFLQSGADKFANFKVQFHLRQLFHHEYVQIGVHGAIVYRFSDIHEFSSFPYKVYFIMKQGTAHLNSPLPCFL